MKISYRWLQDYVDIHVGPDALAGMLTMAGLEVESVDRLNEVPEGVVVGLVLGVRRHPDADRLTVCTVDVGATESLQIVCGAPNVREGQKVAVALVGSCLSMPDRNDAGSTVAVDIKNATIRGVASQGMICAEDELGLSDDHSGIMVLDSDAVVGTRLADYLALKGRNPDAVLDVAVTPNRPDATSHIGVARDVAALTGASLRLPGVDLPAEPGEAAGHIAVSIEGEELCRRYAAVVVNNVTIQESPDWLKRRLEAVGLRPRNNIVDVTNYVMFECGQPLHAFDLDQVGGSKIVVRATKATSKFTTLDGEERELPPGTLMICDAQRPIAIAGVMGGENSEVSDATTNVLIESAYFKPSSVRRTAKALGLQTDASYRFERGVDAAGQVWAARRAADLMADLGEGTVVSGVVDAHPSPIRMPEIELRISRIEKVLGIPVAGDEVVRLLAAIGFRATSQSDGTITFDVPPHRPDVEREIDLIEEVARLIGYDRVEEPTTTAVPSFTPKERKVDVCRQRILTSARGWGYREIYTNSLLPEDRARRYCDPALLGDLGQGTPVTTANAISREMTTLRPTLLPGAMDVIRHNLNHGQRSVRVFEFGHVFTRQVLAENIIPGFEEHESLLLACAGYQGERQWGETDRALDFFDLKGVVASVFSALGISDVNEVPSYEEAPTMLYRVDYEADGTHLGTAAQVHPALAASEQVETPIFFAELNWSRVLDISMTGSDRTYRAVHRFPSVGRDLAFTVEASQDVGPMLDTIRKTGGALLADAGVFDVYAGKSIGKDRKSVAFSLLFSADRTLKDEDVDEQVQNIVAAVRNAYGAELRD